MQVRVKRYFRDIDKKRVMTPGFITDYEESRAKMLASGGFVEILEEKNLPASAQVINDVSEEWVNDDSDAGFKLDLPEPEKNELTDQYEKIEVPEPSKKEIQGVPGKRGRKPKK